ncbi:hypothetical protein [Azospirillum sp. TSH64]|uniref:hypothetical protein n=1 Tax=Azospirillum sp. TSH64 TaxID=652740 RepID=UPI001B3B532B|nr:hypothetical protein [Azospirillum sp. TSH64]
MAPVTSFVAPPPPAAPPPNGQPAGRVEASVSAGGFQVVYSQPANARPGAGPGAGGGSASIAGTDGTGNALATASSFSTFRADDKPAVAIIDGASASTGTADDKKTAP